MSQYFGVLKVGEKKEQNSHIYFLYKKFVINLQFETFWVQFCLLNGPLKTFFFSKIETSEGLKLRRIENSNSFLPPNYRLIKRITYEIIYILYESKDSKLLCNKCWEMQIVRSFSKD